MKSSGWVLLTTLWMLALLSLWVLSSVKGVLLYHTTVHRLERIDNAHAHLEYVADLLIRSDLSGARCIVKKSDMFRPSSAWLMQHGCQRIYANDSYRYMVYDLGIDPCLHMLTTTGKQSTHHWSLTLMSEHVSHDALTIHFVDPIPSRGHCESLESRFVHERILSWH